MAAPNTTQETPTGGQQQGSMTSPDLDSQLDTPEMDGASFEALMKERTRVRLFLLLMICCASYSVLHTHTASFIMYID